MAWIMVGDQLTNTDFPTLPGKPFVGDSPYTFWRIDPNANDGMPYQGLMIGLPVLAPEPPVTTPNIYFGSIEIVSIYYGTQAVSSVYFGNNQI